MFFLRLKFLILKIFVAYLYVASSASNDASAIHPLFLLVHLRVKLLRSILNFSISSSNQYGMVMIGWDIYSAFSADFSRCAAKDL